MKQLLIQARDALQSLMEITDGGTKPVDWVDVNRVLAAIDAAIDELEPEPVAWCAPIKWQLSATSEQMIKITQSINADMGITHPLYANPLAAREPLTDAEMLGMLGDEMDSSDEAFLRFGRAIEAAIGAKP